MSPSLTLFFAYITCERGLDLRRAGCPTALRARHHLLDAEHPLTRDPSWTPAGQRVVARAKLSYFLAMTLAGAALALPGGLRVNPM